MVPDRFKRVLKYGALGCMGHIWCKYMGSPLKSFGFRAQGFCRRARRAQGFGLNPEAHKPESHSLKLFQSWAGVQR